MEIYQPPSVYVRKTHTPTAGTEVGETRAGDRYIVVMTTSYGRGRLSSVT